jgi:uroporphyrinogen III methyltransferase/synthase
VRRCSLPDQETLFTSLGEVGNLVRQTKLRPPAVIIVGDVARERDIANWFTNRPLFGRTVLITRPEHQSQGFAHCLRSFGANVLCQPAIEISEPHDWAGVDDVIERLQQFDWLVFSSANGVRYFFNRLQAIGHDARRLGAAKLAAIGPATAAALAEYHLHTDLQPSSYRAEDLAVVLAPLSHNKRVLLARASRGREVLVELLTSAGAIVEQAVVYESVDVTTANEEVAEALAGRKINWTTVTSSAVARSLVRLFGNSLRKTRLAAISPLTADVLTELGHSPTVVADVYTTDGLADAILRAESQDGDKA